MKQTVFVRIAVAVLLGGGLAVGLVWSFGRNSLFHPEADGSSRVMVNQYAAQPILDAVLAGFTERLSREGNIEVTVKLSNADATTCRQINEQFFKERPNVIVALGTPAAQSAIQVVNGQIPVVFGAITDPVGAKLADSLERPGGHKTGTTNRWPFDAQIRLVRQATPNAKSIGIITSPSEENCVAGVDIYRRVAEEMGLTLVETPITQTSEVKTAASILTARKVDAILVSPSNMLFSALDTLISTAREAGIPVLGGDESAVEKGSCLTLGFSNRDVGVATAEILLEVLKDTNKKAGIIPVASPGVNRLYINLQAMERHGLRIPNSFHSDVVEVGGR